MSTRFLLISPARSGSTALLPHFCLEQNAIC